MPDFTYRWSAQNFESPDLLPYIGRDGRRPNRFAADGRAIEGPALAPLERRRLRDADAH